jgi:NAD(P)H-nitrite reductase large subunit
MGTIEPGEERDEVVQFIEPRKGTYKKVLIRDGHVLGAILLGDISKAAYLLHAFDSNTPLPEERVNLLFDIGAPPRQVTLEQIPMDALICNCNGVNMGALRQSGAGQRAGGDGGDARRHRLRLMRVDGPRDRRLGQRQCRPAGSVNVAGLRWGA